MPHPHRLFAIGVVLCALFVCTGCIRHHSYSDVDGGDLDGSDFSSPELDGFVFDDTQDWDLPEGAECPDGALRCSADAGAIERCEGGQWVEAASCPVGCADAACKTPGAEGSCREPLSLVIGQSTTADNSATASEHTWPSDCTSGYGANSTGPEVVFDLEIPTLAAYRFSLDAVDPTHFGLYLRASCEDELSAIAGVCDGTQSAGGSFDLDTLLAPGHYNVFVDDFESAGNGPGEFSLLVDETLVESCAGQRPTLIDLSSGSAQIMGNTADGNISERWLEFECDAPFSSNGPELIYAFALREAATVRILAEPIEPAESLIALYVRGDCADRYDQIVCAYGPEGTAAAIEQRFEAGAYYLFVDDFASSVDEPQQFQLSLIVR